MRLLSARTTLTVGAVACLSLPFLGEAERLSVGAVLAVAATVLAGVGLYRNIDQAHRRLWALFYMGLVSLVVGTLVRSVHAELVGVEFPFPSPADAIVMAGYFLILAGELVLANARRHENNRADVLDACLVGALIGIPFWSLSVAPFLIDERVSLAVRTLDGVYSVVTIALICATALLAVGPGKRNPAYYMLAVSIFVLFVIDTAAILHDTGVQQVEWLIAYAFPVGFIAFAGAALSPQIARLTDRPAVQEPRLTTRRIALLVASVVVVPVMLLWQVLADRPLGILLTSSGAALISLLVLARMTDLVRANERSIAMERVRSETGERLVTAAEVEGIALATLDGALRLVARDTSPVGVVVITDRSDNLVATAIHMGKGRPPPHFVRLDQDLADQLVVEGVYQSSGTLDLMAGVLTCRNSRDHTFVLPLSVEGSARGLVAVTARDQIDRTTARVLESIVWEACLALRSAELSQDLAREKTERRYRALFENSSDLVCVVDRDSIVQFCSPTSQRALEWDANHLVTKAITEFMHPDDRSKTLSLLRRSSTDRTTHDPIEVRMLHADGSFRWFELLARDLSGEPEIAGIVINAREITDRRAAEQQLSQSEARFRSLVQNSSDVVAVLDDSGSFTYVSPAVTGMLGFRAEDLLGTSVFQLLPEERTDQSNGFARLIAHQPFAQSRQEVAVPDAEGRWHTLDVTLTDLRTEPAVHGVVLNARDVSVSKELEHDLRHQALHDALTGLGNRDMFSSEVAAALVRAGNRLEAVAVLFIDIDDFKTVNDSLGHEVGDELLVAVADRIRNCLRLSDTAARLGGDEFAVLLEHSYGESEVVTVAERILDSLREAVVVQGREINITASMGIAVNAVQSTSAAVLLRNADMAMYLAKERGKDRFEVFEEEMHALVSERLETKHALTRAMSAQELILYYQPILAMADQQVHGVEALVRWKHPTRGLVGPSSFIALAEETGLIVEMGSWILNDALKQLSRWRKRGLVGDMFSMDINLSVRQLRDPGIVGVISDAIQRYAVPASCVVLEITESLLVGDSSEVGVRLEELHELGVQLAVDDFGTGYSSLGYIHKFPIDVIKIDRSFVSGLGGPRTDPTVARAIIDLAAQIGARTVAEGIEEPEELEVLRGLGCDLAQGFLFSRPVPPAEFVGMISPRNGSAAPMGVVKRSVSAGPERSLA